MRSPDSHYLNTSDKVRTGKRIYLLTLTTGRKITGITALFITLVAILTVSSCADNTPGADIQLVIGQLNSHLLYRDISPDTVITSWEVKSDYRIDINEDGSDDYKLSVFNQYMFGGMSLYNSELRIKTLNDRSFVLADSIYPKVLFFHDRITRYDNWGKGDLLLLQSGEGCCPPTGESHHEGYWLNKNENYIGIKHNEKLGWIKTGVENYTSIKIFEYAIQK